MSDFRYAHDVAIARADEHHCPGCALSAEWPGADRYVLEVVMTALERAPPSVRRAVSQADYERQLAGLYAIGVLVGLELARQRTDGGPKGRML